MFTVLNLFYMCGIIAYFGKKNAAPVLIDGLKKFRIPWLRLGRALFTK